MKNSKAMLGLAKAVALAKGPREFKVSQERSVLGYALTNGELTDLYLREGFSANGRARDAHVKVWLEIQKACQQKTEKGEPVLFFYLDIKEGEDVSYYGQLLKAFPAFKFDNEGVLYT